jgi:hypothetical protein
MSPTEISLEDVGNGTSAMVMDGVIPHEGMSEASKNKKTNAQRRLELTPIHSHQRVPLRSSF